tara:strand:+ start:4195 stop:5499 length:1305 start_codon:yes stop_codon:yes gene_type:complete
MYFCSVNNHFKLHINKKFNNFCDQKLLLAFSGGLDSRVLLYLLHQNKIPFSVTHCNFGLRADASEKDAVFCASLCEQLKIPFYTKKFETKKIADHNKISIQMAARDLRYSWFNELKDQYGFTHVLTGHHLDDQLETFLINMGRGTGLKGLRGISTDTILRPLLPFSKNTIKLFAKENKLEWREDCSNSKDDYLRNHIRHHVIPQLKVSNENLLQQVALTIDNLSLAQEALAGILDNFKQKHFITEKEIVSINILEINKLTPADYFLHALFSSYGFNNLIDLKSLLEAQSGKHLISQSHRLIRDRKVLLLSPLKSELISEEIYWTPDKNLTNPIKVSIEKSSSVDPNTVVLDASMLKYPLMLRKFREGDYFCPAGMRGKKKLSKFFKDQKYTLIDKESQWLLCSGEEIVWVIGQRVDLRFAETLETTNPLILKYH